MTKCSVRPFPLDWVRIPVFQCLHELRCYRQFSAFHKYLFVRPPCDSAYANKPAPSRPRTPSKLSGRILTFLSSLFYEHRFRVLKQLRMLGSVFSACWFPAPAFSPDLYHTPVRPAKMVNSFDLLSLKLHSYVLLTVYCLNFFQIMYFSRCTVSSTAMANL